MFQLNVLIVVVLVSIPHLPSTNAGSCEETETAHVKLDLAKQSISNAKLLYPKCHAKNDSNECSEKDKALAHLNAAFDLISEAKTMCHSRESPDIQVIIPDPNILPDLNDRPFDCMDVQTKGFNKSDVYQIWPQIDGIQSNKSIDVYCDMKTDGGGWTVIQRRGNFTNQTDFYQDWETYKKGFGNIKQDFWLGNEKIFFLTNQRNYSVRFDLVDVKGEYRYAEYGIFSIGNEDSGYVLTIRNHSGNATDDMREDHDGSKFSTKDRQNDQRGRDACATMFQSAFWFSNECGYVNLNGVYQPGWVNDKSIWWFNWKKNEGLQSVEIKIRPKNQTINSPVL